MKKRHLKNNLPGAGTKADAKSPAGLRRFQREIAAAVMQPLGPDRGRRRGASPALALVKPNDRLTSFERLEIYNVQYWLRLLGSLREDFPALAAALGEERFEALSKAYLQGHPSRSFTLRDLGGRLPAFVARRPLLVKPIPALARDIARFEWAQVAAFDNEALPPAGPRDLEAPPSRLRLRLQPHLTLLALAHPVDRFVLSLQRDDRLRGEASNAIERPAKRAKARAKKRPPLPKPEKTWLAVHRADHLLYSKRLTAEAFRLLAALGKGLPLSRACEAAFPKRMPKNAAKAAAEIERRAALLRQWFAAWAELGWLAAK